MIVGDLSWWIVVIVGDVVGGGGGDGVQKQISIKFLLFVLLDMPQSCSIYAIPAQGEVGAIGRRCLCVRTPSAITSENLCVRETMGSDKKAGKLGKN